MRNSTLYSVAGTNTFRLASKKILGKWGSNLQNLEKSIRRIYVPDKNKVFVQVDQSGAEALIVAYCCVPARYRQLFIHGVKPHTYLAMHLFSYLWKAKMIENRLVTAEDEFNIDELLNTEIGELKNHPHWHNLSELIKSSDDWSLKERYYFLAKMVEHSSNYGIEPPALRMRILERSGGSVVVSKEDSALFLQTKFTAFPEIKQSYHRYVERCAKDSGVLYNLLGHPLTITERSIDESILKELYAIIPQSTVGEITNIAVTLMYEFIQQENLDWDILANTHDSYLIQCPLDESLACAKQAQEFIEKKLVSPIDGAEFQMRSEASVGFNWSSYKKGKNELGLKTLKQ